MQRPEGLGVALDLLWGAGTLLNALTDPQHGTPWQAGEDQGKARDASLGVFIVSECVCVEASQIDSHRNGWKNRQTDRRVKQEVRLLPSCIRE